MNQRLRVCLTLVLSSLQCLLLTRTDAFLLHGAQPLCNRRFRIAGHRISTSPCRPFSRRSPCISRLPPCSRCSQSKALAATASADSSLLNDDDDDNDDETIEPSSIEQDPSKLVDMLDDATPTIITTTPLQRMRRRKIKILHRKKMSYLVSMFTLWYALSIAYNIFSKRSLLYAPELSYTTAWFQLVLGVLFYIVPLWTTKLRKAPHITSSLLRRLLPVATWHSLVHLGGVVSMSAGAVSFTYIVKASEPAVSAVLSAILLRSFLPLPVYLTLIPTMGGVALATTNELSFTYKSFYYAMLSNIASSMRGIVGKRALRQPKEESLSAMNTYAILTILASVLLLPAAALLECRVWKTSWIALRANKQLVPYICDTILASLFYYTYNEVAFLCLDKVSVVSHALASTFKRVFIILSSLVVFGNPITVNGVLGSSIAILGVLMYSLTKASYSHAAAKRK